MKTKHWILITIFISSSALAGTYNFYFYDDEGKPKTKEENEVVSSQAEGEGSQESANQELTDEKISQLADEVAKRINKNEPQQPAQIVQTVQSIPPSKDDFHFISRDRYLAFGVGMESPFVQDGEIIKDPLAYGKESYFIRAKFFPLIGFEGAIREKNGDTTGYRLAAYTEFNLTKYTALHLIGGIMDYPKNYTKDFMGKKIISYEDRPYGGLGLKLRLFSRLDISGAINVVSNKDIDDTFKTVKNRDNFSDTFKPFYAVGASFVF